MNYKKLDSIMLYTILDLKLKKSYLTLQKKTMDMMMINSFTDLELMIILPIDISWNRL